MTNRAKITVRVTPTIGVHEKFAVTAIIQARIDCSHSEIKIVTVGIALLVLSSQFM